MAITSMSFLFFFLPLALFVYYFADDKAKELVLLLLSIVFYAIGSIQYIVLFSVAVFLSVLIGRGIGRFSDKTAAKKCLLVLGILINVALLGYYKYSGFALSTWGKIISKNIRIKDIALPLGISFFTFKSISYLVDIFKGKAELSENPIHDAVYLSFFAQVQSGPLSRYNDMTAGEQKKFNSALLSDGVYRFMIGFSKKVLLANVLSNITTEVFNTPLDSFSTAYAWLGSVCYSLQLFFDFAGYSDMAIGISEMFGYKCPENFNYPYMTESVARFWRRWHITLSEWFRDYVYIPLGGSRNKRILKVYFNLFVVWLLTGIWHGAAWSFIFWGLGYYVAIALERMLNLPSRLKKPWSVLYRIPVLLFINFQWVLFNSPDLKFGLRYIKRMILPYSNELKNRRTLFLIKDYRLFIVIAIILCTPVVTTIAKKLEKRKVIGLLFEGLVALVVIGAFIWSVSFVVAGQNNPFAYANF
ncbi:MAG: MBOAT family protein [Lachnospiraceae bacterium]|nr:MBOAT family protein [Lachnospiraceae bacterium]